MTKPYTLKRPSENTPEIYATEFESDFNQKIVVAHYFLPATDIDYYVIEYDQLRDEIFCWAELIKGCGELGYASLKELEKIEKSIPVKKGDLLLGYLPVKIEYDEYWKPKKLGEILALRKIS